jgi:hypothetical protein
VNANLNARAIQLAAEDISLEQAKAALMQEGKALVASIGFEAAVDAMAEALDVFERHHWAASERRLRERNPIKGFRLIPKLG